MSFGSRRIGSVGSFASVFLISVDSARPEATNTCTLVMSALRDLLDQHRLEQLMPFSASTSPSPDHDVHRQRARLFALAALDGVLLVAQVDLSCS